MPSCLQRINGGDKDLLRWVSGGRILSPGPTFSFRYPFHPCVTAVACERSQSFCQKCRWQVPVKQACTLRVWLCMMWCDAWFMVYTTHRDGSSFMWYQPCQCRKYTALLLSYPCFITQALSELRHLSKPNHPHNKYREEEKWGTVFENALLWTLSPLSITELACLGLYILLFQTGIAFEW